MTPNLVYWLQPPTVTDTPQAPKMAAERLQLMGKLTQDESIVLVAVGLALTIWVSPLHCLCVRPDAHIVQARVAMCLQGPWASCRRKKALR